MSEGCWCLVPKSAGSLGPGQGAFQLCMKWASLVPKQWDPFCSRQACSLGCLGFHTLACGSTSLVPLVTGDAHGHLEALSSSVKEASVLSVRSEWCFVFSSLSCRSACLPLLGRPNQGFVSGARVP